MKIINEDKPDSEEPKTEDDELNTILETDDKEDKLARCDEEKCEEEKESIETKRRRSLVQWTASDNKNFFPASKSVQKLVPGLYEIENSQTSGIYFSRVGLGTEGLIKFPDSNSFKVVKEIEKFWEREDLFKKFKLAFKRGMLLWGPPGSGKTCTAKMVIEDIIKRNGIVVKFTKPSLFKNGMRIFREIEPNTPVVVLMEDIDSILEDYSETDVINILDGVDMIEKVVFIATTNYPEKLKARIVNRPSRFDKRFKIGHPNEQSRLLYFNYLFSFSKNGLSKKYDLNRWVQDTAELSLAHLKELFIAVVIIGDEYKSAIKTLRSMKDCLDGIHSERKIGY